MSPSTLGLVLTVAVMVGIAVFILLFERRRAREIQGDLRSARDAGGDGGPRHRAG